MLAQECEVRQAPSVTASQISTANQRAAEHPTVGVCVNDAGLLQMDLPQTPVISLKAVVAHLCAPPGTRMSRVTMGQVSGTLPDMW